MYIYTYKRTYIQYSLGVKRDEIHKLEEISRVSSKWQGVCVIHIMCIFQTEEQKLEFAEKYLEQSATMFDEFLKENDKNSVEAIKM